MPKTIAVDGANRHDMKLVADYALTPHIRGRGAEKQELEKIPGYRTRRWIAERSHSWLNRFRRLFICWEKKKTNFLAMLHLSCAYITSKASGVLG